MQRCLTNQQTNIPAMMYWRNLRFGSNIYTGHLDPER